MNSVADDRWNAAPLRGSLLCQHANRTDALSAEIREIGDPGPETLLREQIRKKRVILIAFVSVTHKCGSLFLLRRGSLLLLGHAAWPLGMPLIDEACSGGRAPMETLAPVAFPVRTDAGLRHGIGEGHGRRRVR